MPVRVITIAVVQASDHQYILHASEILRTHTKKYFAQSDGIEQLNYPEVISAIGEGEKTVEIRGLDGDIAVAASLSVYVDGGGLFAGYKLKRQSPDGDLQMEEGRMRISGRARPGASRSGEMGSRLQIQELNPPSTRSADR